ncbi:MAG: hypothetical protein IPL16_00280 [Ignavibacteria bacterium]|nr:hypothetical protein [Ignavibacteria bacterium]
MTVRGVLRYVRIEFAGINLTGVSGNEINGLTMGGVGSRTVIEYVQVSYSGDDSFEWFGGNVNCKYLIAYKGLDDDWDADNGYRGRVQFGLSVRDSTIADVSSSNGFEIDNNNQTPVNFNNPRTKPIFSNMTVVGPFITRSSTVNPLFQRGAHLRRNMLASIYNSIIMGWKTGVRFDGAGVGDASQYDTIQLRNNILAGNLRLADSTGTGSFAPAGMASEWVFRKYSVCAKHTGAANKSFQHLSRCAIAGEQCQLLDSSGKFACIVGFFIQQSESFRI